MPDFGTYFPGFLSSFLLKGLTLPEAGLCERKFAAFGLTDHLFSADLIFICLCLLTFAANREFHLAFLGFAPIRCFRSLGVIGKDFCGEGVPF